MPIGHQQKIEFGRLTGGSIVWLGVPVKCTDRRWLALRDAIPYLPTFKTIGEVDIWVNSQIEYRPDRIDQWASPKETLARQYGDCEDIAILKRAALISSGWKDEDILFLIVRDLVTHQEHAILIVDGHVLDSFNALTLPASSVCDYAPIKGFSADRCWIFGKAAA